MRPMVTEKAFAQFTTETLFVDRTIFGLYRIFSALRARVRLRNEWVR